MRFKLFRDRKPLFLGAIVSEAPTIKSLITPLSSKNITKSDLEKLYIADPVIKGAVDIYRQLILSSGYRIVGDSADKLRQFLEKINFDSLLDVVIKDMLIYGEFWLEKVRSKRAKKKIVGLVRIDPKTMDYIREYMGSNKIKLDNYHRPVGYVQKLPDGSQIEFTYDEIIHGIYNPVENGFRGLGIVEPVYDVAIAKLSMIKSLAEGVRRHGFPQWLITVGNERKIATLEDVEQLRVSLKNLNAKSEIIVPDWVDIKILEPRNIEKIQEILAFYVDQEIASLGIPKALIFGGEATNRATLQTQVRIMRARLEAIRRFLSKIFRQEFFTLLAEQEGWKDVPKIVWNPIELEDIDAKASRLVKYVETGIFTPEEVKEPIRDMEDL